MKTSLLTLICLLLIISSSAHPGIGIVEDSKGNIFYTDLKQIWRIDKSGKKEVVVSNVHTHELFMDASDNLYGEHLWYNGEAKDTWGYYVWRLSASGEFYKVVPDTEGFRDKFSFVQDKSGNMFFEDRTSSCQQVLKGTASKKSKHSGTCFHNIRSMHATNDGSLLVVDFQDVKKIDQQGNVTTIARQIANKSITSSTRENQNSVFGVWDDSNGNIYTAVYSTREIKKFTLAGKEETVYKSPVGWAPSGGLVSNSGELYILENSLINNVRVVSISNTRKQKVY